MWEAYISFRQVTKAFGSGEARINALSDRSVCIIFRLSFPAESSSG